MDSNMVYSFENSFTLAFNQILVGIIGFIPNLIGALVLIGLGFVIAGWLKSLTVKFINITKLDSLIGNPAIKDFLKNAQVSQKMEVVIGEIVRWITIILFFVAGINVLGLTPVSVFLNNIISGIPTLIAAVIILVVGVVFAGFSEKLVKGSLGGNDPSMSRFIGKVVSYAVMVFFILAAVSQLGIARFFIETAFTGFVAALALAVGLTLGLGSKDLVKTLLEDWYKNFKKK